MATKKKSTKQQFNFRASKALQNYIDVASKAAGMTQADFIEQCVMRNSEAVITYSDEKRAELRAALKKLQEDAKLHE